MMERLRLIELEPSSDCVCLELMEWLGERSWTKEIKGACGKKKSKYKKKEKKLVDWSLLCWCRRVCIVRMNRALDDSLLPRSPIRDDGLSDHRLVYIRSDYDQGRQIGSNLMGNNVVVYEQVFILFFYLLYLVGGTRVLMCTGLCFIHRRLMDFHAYLLTVEPM